MRRKSLQGTQRKERDWSATDWCECYGEDEVACLESCVVDREPSSAINSASQSSRKRQTETGTNGQGKRSKTGGVQDLDVSIVLASFSAAP